MTILDAIDEQDERVRGPRWWFLLARGPTGWRWSRHRQLGQDRAAGSRGTRAARVRRGARACASAGRRDGRGARAGGALAGGGAPETHERRQARRERSQRRLDLHDTQPEHCPQRVVLHAHVNVGVHEYRPVFVE